MLALPTELLLRVCMLGRLAERTALRAVCTATRQLLPPTPLLLVSPAAVDAVIPPVSDLLQPPLVAATATQNTGKTPRSHPTAF